MLLTTRLSFPETAMMDAALDGVPRVLVVVALPKRILVQWRRRIAA